MCEVDGGNGLIAQRAALAHELASAPGTLLTIPFLRHLGVQSVRYVPGDAVLRLPIEAHLENSFDMVHGGVTMTLLDVCMAMAARSVINESLAVSASSESHGVITIEMK
ncbi:MAG: PaaI family thioesterase, partial [Betaproteobacteria bacterium]|nr:PaaI family thioesterase [Betaproteobacteria bacterium]